MTMKEYRIVVRCRRGIGKFPQYGHFAHTGEFPTKRHVVAASETFAKNLSRDGKKVESVEAKEYVGGKKRWKRVFFKPWES